MAIRYWHWLLTQKQNEQPEYYEVKGTAEINEQLDPWNYDDYEEDGLIINTEQNENT